MQFEPEGLRRLLIDMLEQCAGNVSELARQIKTTSDRDGHISDKVVRGWLKAEDSESLRRLKPSSISGIVVAARKLEIQVEEYVRPARLWDWRRTYSENISLPVPLPPPLGAAIQDHRVPFLGFTLASRFGISASILTSTPLRASYFAHTCCDVVTLKTIRSRVFPAHDTPNVLFCVPKPPVLSPENPIPESFTLVDADDSVPVSAGMLNHFGVPSLSPEESKAVIRGAQRNLRNPDRQLVIQSIIGTGGPDVTRTELVEDFVRAAVLAQEGGALVIEVNGSCPNAEGAEGRVYQDPSIAADIVKEIRAAIREAKILFKMGYLAPEQARDLVRAIAPHTNGLVSMNTLAVRGVTTGQRGPVPAFHGAEAGLSGDPIRDFGLRSVAALSAIRRDDKLEHLAIIGVGGVTAPEHVDAYIEAGADLVQATSIFFDQPLFGVRVRRSLDRALDFARMSADDQAEIAYFNWRRAYDKLRKENKPITEHAAQAVWLRFHDGHVRTAEAGPRRTGAGFSVADFEKKLLATIGIR